MWQVSQWHVQSQAGESALHKGVGTAWDPLNMQLCIWAAST